MKKVVATGVFNILHPGHILYLREAKKLGDRLYVIVARDENVKGKKNYMILPEMQRLNVIKSLKMVDEAILGDKEDILKPILRIKPDIIALGKDQEFDETKLENELKRRGLSVEVIRINSYDGCYLCSTRRIIEFLRP
ncbi:MAG: FAD synthase [Candidatus Altiarchaeales archaeon]|nr:MAG: FAD synthase [Candidatus Altiarchaeales archaeon]